MPISSDLGRASIAPLHSILLAFPIALFASAAAADCAYLSTSEIQWSNLSQWAITGALLFGAPVILLGILAWFRDRRFAMGHRSLVYLGIVSAMWVLGLINAFKHSQDGWSSVGALGLVLSLICAALALIAGWMRYSRVEGAVA